jgi:hypothetical protein
MCIFCGGACGGAGDILLPSIVAGAGLVVLKVQAIRASSKGKNRVNTQSEEAKIKSESEKKGAE